MSAYPISFCKSKYNSISVKYTSKIITCRYHFDQEKSHRKQFQSSPILGQKRIRLIYVPFAVNPHMRWAFYQYQLFPSFWLKEKQIQIVEKYKILLFKRIYTVCFFSIHKLYFYTRDKCYFLPFNFCFKSSTTAFVFSNSFCITAN